MNSFVSLRLAGGLILAASFPLSAAAAQEAQAPPPGEQAEEQEAPPAQEAPQAEPPIIVAPPAPAPPAARPAPPAVRTAPPAARPTPAPRRPAPAVTPPPVIRRAPAPVTSFDPAPAAPPSEAIPATPSLPAGSTVSTPLPPTVAGPELLPAVPGTELPSAATELPEATSPKERAPADEKTGDNLPLLVGLGLVLAALAAFLLLRRGRGHRVREVDLAARRQAAAAAATPSASLAPLAAAVPVAGAAGVAGRPWIDLLIRPIRAGVDEEEARVEFELAIHNNGSAAAEDVRVSTWLRPANVPEGQPDLAEAPGEAVLPDAIEPGEGKTIATSVALPRELLVGSILPVVLTEARYRLPDGSEGHTSAAFAVGVPLGQELAHFDVATVSGMHENVEARLLGESRKL